MGQVLLVVRPFEGRAVGDMVDAPEEMARVLSGAHAHDVIRVAAPGAESDEREGS